MILSSTVRVTTATVTLPKTSGKFSPPVRLPISSLSVDHRYSSMTRAPFYLTSRCIPKGFVCPCVLSSTGVNSILDDEPSEAEIETRLAQNEGGRRYLKFSDTETEEELLLAIRREAEIGRLPRTLASKLEALYCSYRNAVFSSGSSNANEIVISNMKMFLELVHNDLEKTFIFSPYHKAVRDPFNYYTFGVNYIRPLVDFSNSYVGKVRIFNEIEQNLQQGHNVVLISNHQTEADPAIISLMLEATNPSLAENLIFIAGDRVISDPLCKPFSMGRNLICVYSKKHMNDAPELMEMKKRANITSMKEMAGLFREGSKIVWIAPSGGRDRPGPTGEWYPAAFDASAVENIRRLAEHSDVVAHIYPLAILCHDILPPPPQVEKEIGEERVLSYSGVGMYVSEEIRFGELCASMERNEAKEKFSSVLYDAVAEQYRLLKSAMAEDSPDASLSQPWSFS